MQRDYSYNPSSSTLEQYVDVTNEIINYRIDYPISLTITHKVLYRHNIHDYYLECRLCGNRIYGQNYYAKNIIGLSKSIQYCYHFIRSHRLSHLIESQNHVRARDQVTYWAEGSCVYVTNRTYSNAMDVTEIFSHYDQLLIIKQCDSPDSIRQFHIYLAEKYNSITMGNSGAMQSRSPKPEQTDFEDEFIGHMMMWNYECILCGEVYESGLPSIDLVNSHCKQCTGPAYTSPMAS